MKKLTYQEAYNKVIDAYFNDYIKPMDANFCICGTLCGNKCSWLSVRIIKKDHSYTVEEYERIENALLHNFTSLGVEKCYETGYERGHWVYFNLNTELAAHPDYEELLFKGMCDAIEVLKDIHKGRGEDIDSIPFIKRSVKAVTA
jgi:hypothetical protein